METAVHNDELIEKIERALDSMRPYLAADGGNVRVGMPNVTGVSVD